jgi:6-pyruvoyltetrahydropterin/6-carboxytetrahydropterin synthase
MLKVTKIFRFELAHAIHGYEGLCKNIHGHSYILHVTVGTKNNSDQYLPNTGFIIDFKDLKRIIREAVVSPFDHGLILSEDYLAQHPDMRNMSNLHVWKMEPSVENILLYIKREIENKFPNQIELVKLKLYETSDSYAEFDCE